jgi:hypothetical protein
MVLALPPKPKVCLDPQLHSAVACNRQFARLRNFYLRFINFYFLSYAGLTACLSA